MAVPSTAAIVADYAETVGAIEFDCFVREKHTMSAQATEHAVEGTGQARTDHVMQKPDMLVLEVVASNTPVNFPRGTSKRRVEIKYTEPLIELPGPFSKLTPGLGPLSLATRTKTQGVDFYDYQERRRQDVWDELRRMKEAGEIVSVSTSLGVYTSMVIVEVDTEATVSNARALEAVITLQRIALVDSKLVDAPEIPKPPKEKGKQPAAGATESPTVKASSSFKAADSAGVLP